VLKRKSHFFTLWAGERSVLDKQQIAVNNCRKEQFLAKNTV
jgi:hypothetical protein